MFCYKNNTNISQNSNISIPFYILNLPSPLKFDVKFWRFWFRSQVKLSKISKQKDFNPACSCSRNYRFAKAASLPRQHQNDQKPFPIPLKIRRAKNKKYPAFLSHFLSSPFSFSNLHPPIQSLTIHRPSPRISLLHPSLLRSPASDPSINSLFLWIPQLPNRVSISIIKKACAELRRLPSVLLRSMSGEVHSGANLRFAHSLFLCAEGHSANPKTVNWHPQRHQHDRQRPGTSEH